MKDKLDVLKWQLLMLVLIGFLLFPPLITVWQTMIQCRWMTLLPTAHEWHDFVFGIGGVGVGAAILFGILLLGNKTGWL